MKVSVCIITYNHHKYIQQCLDTVLLQEMSTPWEIVIGDDCSNDGTREICHQYQQQHPEKIRVLHREKNLGMIRNLMDTFLACSGEYVAFIEGDDYWSDPLKLQKQADLLDSSPDASLCFHNALIKFMRKDEDAERPFHAQLQKKVFTTEDLLKQWFIPSASVMCRKYENFSFPEWFVHCKSGDIPFLLLMSLRGNIHYIDEVMSVYRVHDEGVSSTHNGYIKIIAMIFIYENFNIYSGNRFREKILEAERYEIDRHYPAPAPAVMTVATSSKKKGFLHRLLGQPG